MEENDKKTTKTGRYFTKGNHIGKTFSSDYQPKRRRKPSSLRRYIIDYGITDNDVAMVIKNVVFTKNQTELQDIISDDKQPMVVRLVVRAFLQDFKSGNLGNFQVLMARAFGSPKQNIDVDGQLDTSPKKTEEQLMEEIKELSEKAGIKINV